MKPIQNHTLIKNKEDLLRNFILDRSESLFIAGGYQRTSMDMIARECGLSKPTLYNYFDSKYELFTSLYVRLCQGLYTATKELLGREKDKFRVLQDIVKLHFSLMNAKKEFLKMYFREQHLVIHKNIEEHMEWHLRSKKEMVDLLARFLKSIIRPDVRKKFGAEMVASTMFNIFDGLISDLLLRDEKEITAQGKFLMQMLRNGVLVGKAG